MNKIILLRHGETIWNKEKRRQGNLDSPLTELGKIQSLNIGEYLKTHYLNNFNLFVSPQRRTIETAEIIIRETYLDKNNVKINNLLREMSFGIIEGKTSEEIKNNYINIMKKRSKNKWFYNQHGFESYQEVCNRAKIFIDSFLKISDKNINVILTHETFIKMFLKTYLNLPQEEVLTLFHPNNLIIEIEYNQLKKIFI